MTDTTDDATTDDPIIDPLTITRRKMLTTLCDDLNAQGWDQKQKLWIVEGEPEDEYLTLIGEFIGSPRCVLEEKAMRGTLKPNVVGLVVADEAWTYPEELKAQFKTEEALAAFRKLVPPMTHPQRQEVRHLVFVSRDGEAVGLVANRTTNTNTFTYMERGTECPTVDPKVDAMRSLLGTNEPWQRRVDGIMGAFAAACEATDLMGRAMKENWDEKRIAKEVLAHCNPEQREQFLTLIPDELKEDLLKPEN